MMPAIQSRLLRATARRLPARWTTRRCARLATGWNICAGWTSVRPRWKPRSPSRGRSPLNSPGRSRRPRPSPRSRISTAPTNPSAKPVRASPAPVACSRWPMRSLHRMHLLTLRQRPPPIWATRCPMLRLPLPARRIFWLNRFQTMRAAAPSCAVITRPLVRSKAPRPSRRTASTPRTTTRASRWPRSPGTGCLRSIAASGKGISRFQLRLMPSARRRSQPGCLPAKRPAAPARCSSRPRPATPTPA